MFASKNYKISVLIMSLGIVFLGIGIMNGEYEAVLTKAINICLECIGIG